MLQTVEAMMEPDGSVRLLEKIRVDKPTKVLITLLTASNDELENTGSVEGLFGVLTATQPVSLEDMDEAIRKRGSQL